MKQKRWMKSVIVTAAQMADTTATLPWTRGARAFRLAAMLVERRA